MARIPRMLVTGDPTAYHVMSRTALDGFPLGDFEKRRNGEKEWGQTLISD